MLGGPPAPASQAPRTLGRKPGEKKAPELQRDLEFLFFLVGRSWKFFFFGGGSFLMRVMILFCFQSSVAIGSSHLLKGKGAPAAVMNLLNDPVPWLLGASRSIGSLSFC